MCDPVTLGVTAGIGGAAQAFGGLKSAADQKTAEVNNYKRKLQIRRINWDGQRAMYGTKRERTTPPFKKMSCRLAVLMQTSKVVSNDLFKQADSAALDAFARVMENMRYVGSGDRQRREARDLCSTAEIKRGASNLRVLTRLSEPTTGKERSFVLLIEVLTPRRAVSPQPGVPPVKPNVDMTAANLAFIGGMASAVGSGSARHLRSAPPHLTLETWVGLVTASN